MKKVRRREISSIKRRKQKDMEVKEKQRRESKKGKKPEEEIRVVIYEKVQRGKGEERMKN